MFGFVGMIIGVPVFAVIYDIIKKLVARSLEKKNEQHLITEYNNAFYPIEEEKPKKTLKLRKKNK